MIPIAIRTEQNFFFKILNKTESQGPDFFNLSQIKYKKRNHFFIVIHLACAVQPGDNFLKILCYNNQVSLFLNKKSKKIQVCLITLLEFPCYNSKVAIFYYKKGKKIDKSKHYCDYE